MASVSRFLAFWSLRVFSFTVFDFSVFQFFNFSVSRFPFFLVWRLWSHAHLFQWCWSENAKVKNWKTVPWSPYFTVTDHACSWTLGGANDSGLHINTCGMPPPHRPCCTTPLLSLRPAQLGYAQGKARRSPASRRSFAERHYSGDRTAAALLRSLCSTCPAGWHPPCKSWR